MAVKGVVFPPLFFFLRQIAGFFLNPQDVIAEKFRI
jgi:hypothetical protein